MKLAFAAPASGLPSLPTAFGSHASFLHFVTAEVLAAPVRGLPSLPTAWVSQAVCASAEVAKNVHIRTTVADRIMIPLQGMYNLLYHLVGASEQRQWHTKTDPFLGSSTSLSGACSGYAKGGQRQL
jgi:hypothetical protein